MLLNLKMKIIVNPNSRIYYNSIGYECVNYEEIEINIIELPKGSNIEIDVCCDICNFGKKLKYNSYYKNTNGNTTIYTCKKCSHIKSKKTCLERYGDENYTNRKQSKKTCLERYGVDNVSKLDNVKKKKIESNLINWGVENVFQSNIIKLKIYNTIQDKYGTDTYIKSLDFKQKYMKFCDKHGVDHYSQTDEFKRKFEKTCLYRWGYKTNLMNDDIKKRIALTNTMKYGFENHMMNTTQSFKVAQTMINKRKTYYESLGYEMIDYNFESRNYTLIKKDCGHEFNITHDLFRSRIKYGNNSCLQCYPKNDMSSIKEKKLGEFISTISDNVIYNSRKILNGKELDAYLPNNGLAIEFNGLYWHSDVFKGKSYHYDKTISCNDIGVDLMHIWEDDWDNRTEIVKSIIRYRTGNIHNKIYARKCEIIEISNKESNVFLNKNHIQGGVNAGKCISLKYKGDIVSVMTFGKRNINSKPNTELLRFCNRINCNVVGSSSKMFKHFIKNNDFSKIISYSDISLFNGGVYEKLGFENCGKTSLNYYWTDLYKRYHRFNFNKKKLIKRGYDKNKTENEIMSSLGYYKIWSCGQIRWEYSK